MSDTSIAWARSFLEALVAASTTPPMLSDRLRTPARSASIAAIRSRRASCPNAREAERAVERAVVDRPQRPRWRARSRRWSSLFDRHPRGTRRARSRGRACRRDDASTAQGQLERAGVGSVAARRPSCRRLREDDLLRRARRHAPPRGALDMTLGVNGSPRSTRISRASAIDRTASAASSRPARELRGRARPRDRRVAHRVRRRDTLVTDQAALSGRARPTHASARAAPRGRRPHDPRSRSARTSASTPRTTSTMRRTRERRPCSTEPRAFRSCRRAGRRARGLAENRERHGARVLPIRRRVVRLRARSHGRRTRAPRAGKLGLYATGSFRSDVYADSTRRRGSRLRAHGEVLTVGATTLGMKRRAARSSLFS